MKTALITGVGKGIGRALARTCVEAGYRVLGTYLETKPEDARAYLDVFRLDLASGKSIAACAKRLKTAGHRIDLLINNAGVLLDEDETAVNVKKLRATLEVNLIGTIDFTEHMVPLMRKGGHIINISSRAGSLELTAKGESHHPYHYPAYKISKAALNMYARTLAQRLSEKDITVSSVHPGWVKTDIGGDEADLTPEQAAKNIVRFAAKRPESGQFWFEGKRMPW